MIRKAGPNAMEKLKLYGIDTVETCNMVDIANAEPANEIQS